jgi:hypothetical protein
MEEMKMKCSNCGRELSPQETAYPVGRKGDENREWNCCFCSGVDPLDEFDSCCARCGNKFSPELCIDCFQNNGESEYPSHFRVQYVTSALANCVNENRIGRFSISLFLIQTEPQVLLDTLFSQIVIVDAKSNAFSTKIDYIGFSPLFEPVERGVRPTEYELVVTKVKDEALTKSSITATKLKYVEPESPETILKKLNQELNGES